jgi:PAS domain S-box-containing protein
VFRIITEDYSKFLLDGAPFGFAFSKLICDESAHPVDCEILKTNEQFKALLGLGEGDLSGWRVSKLVPRIERSIFNWFNLIGHIALSGGSKNFEFYLESAQKWFRVFVYSQKKYYMGGIFFDITAEKKQLQEQDFLIHSMNDVLIELDQNYIVRRFVSFNKKYNSISEIVLDSHIGDIMDQALSRQIMQVLKTAAVSKDKQFIEIEMKNKTGTSCYGIRIAYKEGERGEGRFLISINNISNRYYIESKFEDVQQDMQQIIKKEDNLGLLNYSTFINTMDEMLVVADTCGCVLFVNHAFRKKLGYEDEDISGMHFLDFSGKENRKLSEILFSETLNGKRKYYPMDMVTKDGKRIPSLAKIWHGNWFNRKCIFVLSGDVLQRNGELYRLKRIFDFNPVVIALVDAENYCLEDTNLAFLLQFGFSKEELKAQALEEILTYLNVPVKKRLYIQTQLDEGKELENVEIQVQSKSGSCLHCLLSSRMLLSQSGEDSILLTFSDITEVKSNAGRGAYRFIEKELIGVAFELCARPEGKIHEVLQGSLKRLGEFFGAQRAYVFKLTEDHTYIQNTNEWYARDIVHTMDDLDTAHVDSIKSYLETFFRDFADHSGSMRDISETWNIEQKYFEGNQIKSAFVVPVCLGKELAGFIGFDFADDPPGCDESIKNLLLLYAHQIGSVWHREKKQKKADTEENAPEVLEQSSDVNLMKNYFIASLSHEVKTLINSMIGSSYLLRQMEPTPTQMKYIKVIENGNYALLEIAGHMLEASKMEAGMLGLQKTEFSVYDVFQNIVSLFEVQANEKGMEIVSYVDSKIPGALIGDRSRLNQLLNNLVSNAVKFSEKGTIRMICELKALGAKTADLTFRVEDEGPGIAQDERAHIFEAFWRGQNFDKTEISGTGLGLPICKKLTEMMEGELCLDSITGEGTSFRATLPMEIANPKNPYEISLQEAKRLAVWIYDGNEYHSGFLARTLRDYQIECRVNVESAEMEKTVLHNKKTNIFLIDNVYQNQEMIQWIGAMEGDVDAKIIYMVKDHEMASISEADIEDDMISRPVTASVIFKELLPRLSKDTCDPKKAGKKMFCDAKVLVVEDSEAQIDVLVAILNQYGIHCDLAQNGEEAVLKVKSNPYDLILMDIHMASINGIEAVQTIRHMENGLNNSVPILALTAQKINKNIWEAMNINGCITKPVHPVTLFNSLVTWIPHKLENSRETCMDEIDLESALEKKKVLDIAEGLKILADDEALYKDLLKKLMDTNLVDLGRVKELFARKQYKEVMDALHSVKGTFGSLGAFEIYCEIRTIEYKVKSRSESAKKNFEKLDCCIRRLRNEINKYLDIEDIRANGS